MKTTRKHHNHAVSTLLAYLLLLVSSSLFLCVTAVKGVAAEPGALDLKQEANLAVKVSFEAKRQPLSALLNDLSQQSGIKLTAAPSTPAATARITARVANLELATVMNSLAQLYSVSWNRVDDKAYAMQPSQESEVDAKLRQLGDLGWFRYWNSLNWFVAPQALGIQPPADWGAEIIPLVNYQALRKDGVPFRSLPEDIQERLRADIQAQYAESVVRDYAHASTDSLMAHGYLTVGIPDGHTPAGAKFTTPIVTISAAGHPMLLIFHLLPQTDPEPPTQANPPHATAATPQK